MRYAIWLPNFGEFGDVRRLAALAREAEAAGWDGFFLWDHVFRSTSFRPGMPAVDPWVALAAVALSTERLRIGTMVTPVPRRRPWKLARELVSLDHLSGGRVTLGVGIGSPGQYEFGSFGEDTNARVRARRLDEALDILIHLWSGESFSYEGEHFRIDEVVFQPTPVQRPRIPIWVAAIWPNRAPVLRAARWDGLFPLTRGGPPTPSELREILQLVEEHRTDAGGAFDVAISGATGGEDPGADAGRVAEYRAAGATWWLERLHEDRGTFEELRRRVLKGPPRA